MSTRYAIVGARSTELLLARILRHSNHQPTHIHTLSPSALDAAAADADTGPPPHTEPFSPGGPRTFRPRLPVRGFGVGRVRVLRAPLLSGGTLTRPDAGTIALHVPAPGSGRPCGPRRRPRSRVRCRPRRRGAAEPRRCSRADPRPGAGDLVRVGLAGGGRVHPDPQVPVGESPGRIPAGVRTPPRPSSTPPRRGRRGSSPAAPPEPARSSGKRRDRRVTRETVPLADVLVGYPTISRARTVILRTRPEAGWDGAGTGTRSATTPS